MKNLNTGKDLKSWREENRLTRSKFCEMSGYSVCHISHVEISDKPLSKRLKEEIHSINETLNPKEDPVIEAWRRFRNNNHGFIRIFAYRISETLPDLLSTREYGKNNGKKRTYIYFLDDVLHDLLKIKELSYNKREGSVESSLRVITDDLYDHALCFLERIYTGKYPLSL